MGERWCLWLGSRWECLKSWKKAWRTMDKQRGTWCIMHACASSFLPQMGVSSNQRPIRVVHALDARLDRNYRRSNSLSLSLFPSFFLSFSLASRWRRWNKCLFVSTTNRLIRPFTRLEISISVTTKGLISLGAVVLVGYYSGSSLSHVTQQWYSSYSGNDYENARVDLAPQETPPKRSNYNSTCPNLPPSIQCVYIYIYKNFLLDQRSWRDSKKFSKKFKNYGQRNGLKWYYIQKEIKSWTIEETFLWKYGWVDWSQKKRIVDESQETFN